MMKSIQIFSLMLFFGSIKCDNLLLKDSFDDFVLEHNAGCTANCLQNNLTTVRMTYNITVMLKMLEWQTKTCNCIFL